MAFVRLAVLVAMGALVVACGDDEEDGMAGADAAPLAPDAAPPDAAPPDAAPACPTLEDGTDYERLCQTGFDDPAVAEYAPRFALWSDGADKRRWVLLPDGDTIDTTDMDFWQYPVGTRLWKEFSRDGVLLETRLLEKRDDGWFMIAFAWNEDQTEAVAAPFGALDVLGTDHDIPSQSRCGKCHDRMPDRVLGFSAIQLAHGGEGVTLADLIADGALSDPPASGDIALPGDAVARAALGYLHANCGNCHNEHSDVMDTTGLRQWLKVGELGSVEETSIHATGVEQAGDLTTEGATALIEPGAPETSAVHIRMNTRGAIGMPPLATELVDTDGLAAVDSWITALGE